MTIVARKNTSILHYDFTKYGIRYQGSTGTSCPLEAKKVEDAKKLEVRRKHEATQQAEAAQEKISSVTTPISTLTGSLTADISARLKTENAKQLCNYINNIVWLLGADFPAENISDDTINYIIVREKLMRCLRGREDFKSPTPLVELLISAKLHPHPTRPDLTLDELTKLLPDVERHGRSQRPDLKPLKYGAIGKKTINPVFEIVKKAKSVGVILVNPPDRSKYKRFKSPIGCGFLSYELTNKLFSTCPPERARVYDFAIECVLRVSEVCRLRHQDIDLVGGYLTVLTKGGGSKRVPMSNNAKQIITEKIGRHSVYVFTQHDRYGNIKKLNGQIARDLKADLEFIGVIDLRFHDLRRTGAQRAYDNGVSIHHIQYLLDHVSVWQSWDYIGRDPEEPDEGTLARHALLSDIKKARVREGVVSPISARDQALGDWMAGALAELPIAKAVALARANAGARAQLVSLIANDPAAPPEPRQEASASPGWPVRLIGSVKSLFGL